MKKIYKVLIIICYIFMIFSFNLSNVNAENNNLDYEIISKELELEVKKTIFLVCL
jgi:hypothetical protein